MFSYLNIIRNSLSQWSKCGFKHFTAGLETSVSPLEFFFFRYYSAITVESSLNWTTTQKHELSSCKGSLCVLESLCIYKSLEGFQVASDSDAGLVVLSLLLMHIRMKREAFAWEWGELDGMGDSHSFFKCCVKAEVNKRGFGLHTHYWMDGDHTGSACELSWWGNIRPCIALHLALCNWEES